MRVNELRHVRGDEMTSPAYIQAQLRDQHGETGRGSPALQQLLGHASLNTTAVYLQFNDEGLQEMYAKNEF